MDILPDLLKPGLRVVFCGTAPGAASAAQGAYYAGPGNRFWPALHQAGFTPRVFRPQEFAALVDLGIGLTDMAKSVFGQDQALPPAAFDRARFTARMRSLRPAHIAFTSKRAAAEFFGVRTAALAYGAAPKAQDFPPMTVLPSPSGLAVKYWDARPWLDLALRLGFGSG